MSLMSWLMPARSKQKSELSGGAQRKGVAKEYPAGATHAARRKGERAARRELLYSVVREAMVRAGVLTSTYKFKVLSLDASGSQYLVMIDLARGADNRDPRGEIEALIIQSARSRHEIVVTSVYWRTSENAAVGSPDTRRPGGSGDSTPMPLESQPAPLDLAPAPLIAPAARGPAFEPIQADEVEAFRRALVAGSTGPLPLETGVLAPARRFADGPGPRNYTLLTGYEDTELPEDRAAPLLSGTQYGELR
jgi:hypothetical protein